jgi:hypothetical protein
MRNSSQVRIRFGGPSETLDRDSLVAEVAIPLDSKEAPTLLGRIWQCVEGFPKEPLDEDRILLAKERLIASLPLSDDALGKRLLSLLEGVPFLDDASRISLLRGVDPSAVTRLQRSESFLASKGLMVSGDARELRPILESIFGSDRLLVIGD